MLNLTIDIEVKTSSQIEYALEEEILRLVQEGYTSGINPTFDISGEEEEDEDSE